MPIANTSRQSYDEHIAEGKREKQLTAVLNLLRKMPSAGLSRNELSRVTGFQLSAICGRVGELKDAGLVVEDAPRRDPTTGRSCKPVRIAPDLFAK